MGASKLPSDIKRSKGRQQFGTRGLVTGEEKIGKSTFALGMPKPAHLDLQRGTYHLDVADRFEVDQWSQIESIVNWIWEDKKKSRGFQSVIIDPVGAMQAMLFEHVCEKHGKNSISDWDFGTGYNLALDAFRRVWIQLEDLYYRRLHVLLVGHTTAKTIHNPIGHDYHRYVVNLTDRLGGFIRQEVDWIGYATYETTLVVEKGARGKKTKPKATGARVMHTRWSPAFDAGCRRDIPSPIEFSWPTFYDAYLNSDARAPARLVEDIRAILEACGDSDLTATVEAEIEKHAADALWLSRALDRLRLRFNENEGDEQ